MQHLGRARNFAQKARGRLMAGCVVLPRVSPGMAVTGSDAIFAFMIGRRTEFDTLVSPLMTAWRGFVARNT